MSAAQPPRHTGASALSIERQVWFWLAALGALIVAIWLLHEILLPFVAGMALAYLLDPLANRIEAYGINRFAAILVMMGMFALALMFLVILIVPVLAGQLSALIDNLPDYSARLQALVTDPNRPWLKKLVGAVPDFQVSGLIKEATGGLVVFLRSLWSGGQALVSLFSLLVITPVVAFYLLYDWERVIATLDSWLPRDHAVTIRQLAREIDTAIAGFVRGQTGIAMILGSLYIVGFLLVGLNFSFLIGLFAGLASFVPYVGSFAALLLATGVAAAQFWPEWLPIVAVLGICVICQVLEGYVLSPFLVGASIGLHPVWLMFALLSFSYLFGFLGLLVAIPVSAAVGVLARFALRKYLASPVYTGHGTA